MNTQQRNEFFNKIAIAINTTDIKVARNAYYSIAKFIVRETKKDGELKMPDLGTFRIAKIKGRISNIPLSNEKKVVPASNMMRFKPDYKVKHYINH